MLQAATSQSSIPGGGEPLALQEWMAPLEWEQLGGRDPLEALEALEQRGGQDRQEVGSLE